MTTEGFDLEHPPWSVEAGGTGDSDDWGDEQNRSEWYEEAAHHYAARVTELERQLDIVTEVLRSLSAIVSLCLRALP